MSYEDFTIQIRSTEDGRFEAQVIDAPISERPRVTFDRPLTKECLSTLLTLFELKVAKKTEATIPHRDIGKKLHAALFQAELADLFERCRSDLPPDDSTGLRVRLQLHRDDPEIDYLSALPWEWLCDESSLYLATSRSTPLVRHFIADTPRPLQPISRVTESPLRILVVGTNPVEGYRLDLAKEIDHLGRHLDGLEETGQVELLGLRRNTLKDLRNALRDEAIHVVHFMGHAGYHAGSGFGAVFFEKENGKEDQVSGIALAQALDDTPDLRLVVLNACWTARDAGRESYSGVARAILEQTRVAAVLANQHNISDEAAVSFASAFYQRIARGDAIDEALSEFRLQFQRDSFEWGTPVLFLAASDGRICEIEPAERGSTVRRLLERSSTDEESLRLGIRSFDGWGGHMEPRNAQVLALERYFEERYIQKQEWWQKKVLPDLRDFFQAHGTSRRPLVLDLAAHSSIAFAAGWLLEAKSGFDVRFVQRTRGRGECEWNPEEGEVPEGALWLDRPDVELSDSAPDVAVALSVTHPNLAAEVREKIERSRLPVGRIIDATIAPKPSHEAIRSGAHILRLAQDLLPRLRERRPHERSGRLHIFCAGPNALLFYLGQLSRVLGRIVLYEYAFCAEDRYSKYGVSIELPPPDQVRKAPSDW